MTALSLRPATTAAFVFVASVVVAIALVDQPRLALAVGLLAVAAGAASHRPSAVLIFVAPACFLAWRIGGNFISLADVAVVGGALVAVGQVDYDNPRLRGLLRTLVLYELMLLPVVAMHPDSHGIFEWLHRFSLVGGSLLVGAAIGRASVAHLALRLYVGAATVVAIAAIAQATTNGFVSAYPFGMQKNFAGALLMMAIIACLPGGRWVGLPQHITTAVRAVLALGLLSTQSRGALVALIAGLMVWAITTRDHTRRAVAFILVSGIASIMLVYTTVSDEIDLGQTKHTSITSRQSYQAKAWRAWEASPLLGEGLRFFDRPTSELRGDPHSVLHLSLAESGIVGVGALLVLIGSTVVMLRRTVGVMAKVAVTLLIARLVHGQFDIYWVAGSQAFPWIIIGIAVASADVRAPEDAHVD